MSSRLFTAAAAAVASLAVAAPAGAAISSPPAGGNEITVFPERDFVAMDPWEPNTDFRMEVVRNGVVISSANGTTDADGFAEINHPGGVCWNGVTPDILPGDVVRAIRVDGTGAPILDGGGQPIGDATTTAGVTATQAEAIAGQLIVHGTAVAPGGGQIPIGQMEQRIVEPALLPFVNKRDIRAPGGGDGFTSTLTYDAPGSNNWTATYNGLSGGALTTAAAGQTRILSWMASNAAGDRFGITIFEVGELGGPGFGGCPAGARNAVIAPGIINAANVALGAAPTVISGAAQPDATAVALTITDGTTTLNIPAADVTLANGSWTANVPADQIATLADGNLTVDALYTVPGGDVTGVPLTVVKDTVAPEAPTANPAAGTYEFTQQVLLHSADPAAEVHYTTNGADPTAASPVARSQIGVTNSMTLKALAIDPAGNASAISALAYVIQKPNVAPPAVPPVVIVQNTTPVKLTLGALTMRRTIARSSLRRSGLRANTRVAKGTEVLRVRVYKGKKLVTSAFRFPSKAGLYKVVLKSAKVKRLRAGRYVLEITPGTSRQNLGAASRRAFRVR